MENRGQEIGVTWESSLVAYTNKKKKQHDEVSAGSLKVNNNGKAMKEKGTVEKHDPESFFTSAQGNMEARLEVVLF